MSNTAQTQGVFDLFLTKEELTQLDNVIGELPTKFGVQLIRFFQLIGQKRQAEAQAEIKKNQETDVKGKDVEEGL